MERLHINTLCDIHQLNIGIGSGEIKSSPKLIHGIVQSLQSKQKDAACD